MLLNTIVSWIKFISFFPTRNPNIQWAMQQTRHWLNMRVNHMPFGDAGQRYCKWNGRVSDESTDGQSSLCLAEWRTDVFSILNKEESSGVNGMNGEWY